MGLDYFPCYHSYRRKLAKLSDQEVGRLFRALLEYSETGETKELAGRESLAFDFIADDIDRAKENYQKKSEQNRVNRAGTTDNDRQRPITTDNDRQRPSTTDNVRAQNKNKSKDKSKSDNTTPYNPPPGDAFVDFAGDNQILLEALRAFEESRKKNKKPMTGRAKELLVGELVKSPPEDWITMLENATLHGWQSVYPLKKEDKPEVNLRDMNTERFKRLREREAANG